MSDAFGYSVNRCEQCGKSGCSLTSDGNAGWLCTNCYSHYKTSFAVVHYEILAELRKLNRKMDLLFPDEEITGYEFEHPPKCGAV